jgi:hypothetical protein
MALLSSPGFGGTVRVEEKEIMNGPRNPMKESDVEKVDEWVLKHIDEEKFLVEDYDEVSKTRLDVYTLDGKGRKVIFKLEVKKGKVKLVGKKVIRED